MNYAINVLLDQPLLLIFVLLIGAGIGIGVEKFFNGIEREKRRAYWRGRKSGDKKVVKISPRKETPASTTETAGEQLMRVMNASFKARPLLNKPERRLLGVIDQALAEHSPGWRTMGQVSLGEILYSPDKDAFWAINAKRVDLLIVDSDCRPLHAVEFQGTGHHSSAETAARDAVKKEALRRAGIGYVEVVSGDTPAEVREMVRKLTARAPTA
ncbi:DUF2726 domain-containing protein [Croceicoccus gelatinilyticus]|uniref:DUF2726 domain-containing protein n=1 Tax=Croceicoccus gelatinilyticus TaxID=2835536 RepID=UPI001BCC2FDB|nr:DUF2726 domain-containing protein [Croceicoccus gelatinilyticus]MBS7668524.1 DUF2726 domain-containing protein [Croceicoccus gelatinilyticus]